MQLETLKRPARAEEVKWVDGTGRTQINPESSRPPQSFGRACYPTSIGFNIRFGAETVKNVVLQDRKPAPLQPRCK